MPNMLISSEIGSERRIILGHPQMIECMGIWRMDLIKGVPTLFAHCEKLIWKLFFKFNRGMCPWMAFPWIFFGIFLIFLDGGGEGGL